MAESASQPKTGGAAPKKGKKDNRPSPEEIEAKRRERAAKKEREAAEKAAKEAELAAAIVANGKIPNGHLDDQGNVLFVPRDWADVTKAEAKSAGQKQKIRIVSWNILAQGLVRRKLFPGSDCLKFKDRSVGLTAELSSRTGHGWDVGCFQEVDRMDVHGEMMQKDGFSYVYEKGYRQKQHGLLVAWKKDLFGERPHSQLTIDLDAESVAPASEPVRTACSRVTRNVGLFIALHAHKTTDKDVSSPGLIVATTHLFWHPMHAYERTRQSGILVRKLQEFRAELGEDWKNAPCILAGDFNDQPHSATYHLLTGRKLTPHCYEEVLLSSVVHKSIDERREKGNVSNGFAPGTTEPARDAPSTKKAASTDEAFKEHHQDVQENDDAADEEEAEEAEEGEEEGEGEGEGEGEAADDRMLKNCRAATAQDALLSMDELLQLHDVARPRPGSVPAQGDSTSTQDAAHSAHLGSAYALHYGHVQNPSEEGNFFGSPARGRERWDDPDWTPETPNCHTGDSTEPMWTIFSSLFSLTLDYIFMLPKASHLGEANSVEYPTVTRLLRTHRTETLQPGVPRRGVCASDHIAIGAEIEL
ncbi:hypothetical protein NDA16_004454 [Ustilago loliicola]|nr:hypothetical protein NDA16_004454 [Ustilago loliicola]